MDDTQAQAQWVILAGLNDHEGYSDPTVHGAYPSPEAAIAAGEKAFGPRPSNEDLDMPEDGSLWDIAIIQPL